MASNTIRQSVHPKWISCFPGGVHRWDDGTPDPEEFEVTQDRYEADAAALTSEMHERTLDQILREMGF